MTNCVGYDKLLFHERHASRASIFNNFVFFLHVAYLGELSGFRSSAFGVSVLVGCAIASLGDWCLTLRHVIVVSSSLVKMSMKT